MPVQHIYVHIPFCHRICPYCAFYKHQPGNSDIASFVQALLTELRAASTQHDIRPETIFFGGGTPTFLSRHHLEPLLAGFNDTLDLTELREWTFEANPATFGLEKAKLMREGGVNRLSLGVQSFDPDDLKTLGRDHAPGDIAESVAILREAGFENVSLDLMFALPGQPLPRWESSLSRALALSPQHLSCYNLTYEEDTDFMRRFEKGEYTQDNDRDAPFFERASSLLGKAGFHHYEISNYARPGFEARHNQACWRGADYLGLGPSAVSTVGGRRWKNLPDTTAYTRKVLASENIATEPEELSETTRANEAVALQLRTSEGLDRTRVPHLTDAEIAPLLEEALLLSTPERLTLTPKGRLVADAVAAHLFI